MFLCQISHKRLSRITSRHQSALVRLTNGVQIVTFTSQVTLSSGLIPPPPLIHFLLLAFSTRCPRACLSVSLDMPAHRLVSPDFSILKCPRALDTQGDPATSCRLLHLHLVPSLRPLPGSALQLPPCRLTDSSPPASWSDRFGAPRTPISSPSRPPSLSAVARRPPRWTSHREAVVASGTLQGSSCCPEHTSPAMQITSLLQAFGWTLKVLGCSALDSLQILLTLLFLGLVLSDLLCNFSLRLSSVYFSSWTCELFGGRHFDQCCSRVCLKHSEQCFALGGARLSLRE